MRRLASFAQGQPAPFCLRDVRLCHRRAVRSRRHGYHQRPGTDAALRTIYSAVLVRPGVAGDGRVDYRDSCRGRVLPLGARRIRRLLGIPCGLVELERIVRAGRRLRGTFCRLSQRLYFHLFHLGWRRDPLRHRLHSGRGDLLRECAWDPHGGSGLNHTRGLRAAGRGCFVRRRCAEVAPQPVFATGPSARAEVSGFWRRAGARLVALLRVRATFKRCRRKWKSRRRPIRGHWRLLCRFRSLPIFFRHFFRSPPSEIGRNGIPAIFQTPRNSLAAPGWPFPSRSRR